MEAIKETDHLKKARSTMVSYHGMEIPLINLVSDALKYGENSDPGIELKKIRQGDALIDSLTNKVIDMLEVKKNG